MALQTKINGRLVRGIVGEFADSAPKSATSYIVFGKNDSSKPTFGKFFSLVEKALSTGSSAKTTVAVQGVGAADSFAMGILVNPKEHFTHGFVTTLEMDAGLSGEIATVGHIYVLASTDVDAGAPVYVDANGNVGDDTLANSIEVVGAKFLLTATIEDGKTTVLTKVGISNPVLATGAGSN